MAGFNPQAIEEAIRNAGAQLQEMWKKPGQMQMPENDLHPDPSALQFRCKLMEDRLDVIENVLGQVVRELKARKNGG